MNDRDRRPLVVRRLQPGHWVFVDVALAFGMSAVCVGVDLVLRGSWLTGTVAVLLWSPIAVRRLWPLPVLAAMLVATVCAAALALPETSYAIGFALFTVGRLEPCRRAVAGLCAAVPTVAVSVFIAAAAPWWQRAMEAGTAAVFAALTWVCGRALRETGELARLTAAQAAAHAVTEERLRIARDLHDVVAHGMSVITLRAAVAAVVCQTRPEEAPAALRLIEHTGRSTMVELRNLLGALRTGTTTDHPETEPVPGLRDLPRLAARAQVFVDLRIPPDVRLPEGLELTVYRIVQEALTNVAKHSSATSCQVTVRAPAPGVIEVEVLDAGPGKVAVLTGGGYGLVGMAERVRTHGGVLNAGPRPDGGFRVRARLTHDGAVPR
ncbi:sensor histidine kinase [Embleya sp. NPDC020630]|uniref:sensor histidine kinase n=1 Tax=Embleya sp. NPDC020630 TaxID=3363979 RepID=UPI003789B654